MTTLDTFSAFLYSVYSIGAGLVLLTILCAVAWMRGKAQKG